MSYNGSGLFQINTSGQPVVAGTVITASAFNALTADLATGLTTAITKDGQTATTAQIPFAQGLRSTLTTDSTNSTSGSIITDGGLGVAKAVNIGSTLNVAGTTDSTTSTTGTIITAGGLGVAKAVNIGTTLGVTGAVTGSSTITGTKLIPTGTSVTGNGMYLPATNTLGFSTNGSNAVNIDASQNVGVGVTPSAWGSGVKALQFDYGAFSGSSSIGTEVDANCYYNGTNWIYRLNSAAGRYNQGVGAHSWYTAASGTAGNAITWTTAMMLDASSNLLMGRTDNPSGVSGCFYSVGTYNQTSGVAGNVAINANGLFVRATASSQRFKENITDWTDSGLSLINKLKPRTFTYKADYYKNPERTFLGLIAEEVQPESSYLVDFENEDGTGQVDNVRYANIVVPLVKAIQEQQALIQSLTDRLTALEGAAK